MVFLVLIGFGWWEENLTSIWAAEQGKLRKFSRSKKMNYEGYCEKI
jgi:hypothetical protein